MSSNWRPLFMGVIDDRPVKLMIYESGELRVETTQAKTEATRASSENGQTIMPIVISKGDTLQIDANTPEELRKELIACDFSENGAKELARLATQPGDHDRP